MGRSFNLGNNEIQELKKAINDFNSKIEKLEKLDNEVILPDKLSFEDFKNNIGSKLQYDRELNSLKKFMKEGAEKAVEVSKDVFITKWQQHEAKIAANRIIKENEGIVSSDTSRFMKPYNVAQAEYKLTQAKNINSGTIKAMQENFNYIFSYDRRKFEKLNNYVNLYYEKVLPQFKNYKNYDLLKKELDRRKNNPKSFYKYVSNAENLSDINLWYPPDDIEVGGNTPEETFNLGLSELGIDIIE